MIRKVEKYDFKAFGQAIKEARNSKGMSSVNDNLLVYHFKV